MLHMLSKTLIKSLLTLVMCLLLGSIPVCAQIKNESKGEHKHMRKKFLKESDEIDTQYNDSHLDLSSYNFRKGEPGRLRNSKKKKQVQVESVNTGNTKRFLFWKRKEKQN
jgi:hypothetical protein